MSFPAETIVRYQSNGPRPALCGCIGVVVKPSSECIENGWVRASFHSIVDDYSRDELEPARFWAYLSTAELRWRGPFDKWHEAVAAAGEMLRASADFPADHPLAYARDRLISDMAGSDPVPSGIVGYHSSAGTVRVVVAGQEQPSLYDKSGKKYG